MVLVEHIQAKDHETLDRVIVRIRRFWQEELSEKETLEIQWGTKKGFAKCGHKTGKPQKLQTQVLVNLGDHDSKYADIRISESILRALLISYLVNLPGCYMGFPVDRPIKDITFNKETMTFDINFEKRR